MVTDVSQRESVQALADRVFAATAPCHVLCNNAGVGAHEDAPVWETAAQRLGWIFGVNVWGVIHGIQAFVPRMLATARRGTW